MRVHSEPQQFKIFADGNADIRRVESLVGFSNEMVQRAGSRRASDTSNIRLHRELFIAPCAVTQRRARHLLGLRRKERCRKPGI
jgi:hypothetical protein